MSADGAGTGPRLPRVGRASLRDEVAQILEQRILDGSFPAGERVPSEFELTERFGVSRTVVRDALRVLETRGLVETRHGIGTLVKPASFEAYAEAIAMVLLRSDLTIGDVFEARATLEGQLAFVAAANHTPAQLDEFRDALERFEQAVAAGNEAGIVGSHVDFHTGLLRATNLPALEMLVGPIQGLMLATSLAAGHLDPVDPRGWRVDIHQALYLAVAERDPSAVAAANDLHWATPIRDESYRTLRAMRINERFPTPRDLLRDCRFTPALWSAAGRA